MLQKLITFIHNLSLKCDFVASVLVKLTGHEERDLQKIIEDIKTGECFFSSNPFFYTLTSPSLKLEGHVKRTPLFSVKLKL